MPAWSSPALGSVFPPTVRCRGLSRCRFHLTPELLVGDSARFLNLTPRLVEEGLELGRMRQHQAFEFVIVGDRQQHGHRLAVPRNDDGTFLARSQVRAQARLHISDRGKLHLLNSSSRTTNLTCRGQGLVRRPAPTTRTDRPTGWTAST